MSEARFIVGDVFEEMAKLPDDSVDLIVTSPPFLALRSYLPDGHPDKHLEIGSEATPAAFLSTLLRLTQEWRRLLAPHGSICVELGDTYSGSKTETREDVADGSRRWGGQDGAPTLTGFRGGTVDRLGPGWPLAKSLCGIPDAYHLSLIYGRNILNPTEQFEPWRVRNKIVWHRPNPPVGALGDKVRPSTSYITVACVSKDRWFDLDSERTAHTKPEGNGMMASTYKGNGHLSGSRVNPGQTSFYNEGNPAGAPLLDCWTIPTQPYSGAHYATFPQELPKRLINLMCPLQVCTVCGEPRRRIVEHLGEERRPNPPTRADFTNALTAAMQRVGLTHHDVAHRLGVDEAMIRHYLGKTGEINHQLPSIEAWRQLSKFLPFDSATVQAMSTVPAEYETPDRGNRQVVGRLSGGPLNGDKPKVVPTGWTDCGHDAWRRGHVLDPFCGSGTTLAVATGLGRDATGIDLDSRNLDLARERIGMFLTEDEVVA